MAGEVRMILPKGIVLNTETIYDGIASYPVLPWQKLHQVWKVYNTTNRELLDPTARRLENLWWRVWGSKCRNSSGKIIAGVYRDISIGSTVVPIRGPENRWEPGRDEDEYNRAIGRNGRAIEDSPSKSPEKQDGSSGTDTSTALQTRPTAARAQSATSQVALHPILKKDRRSSNKRQMTRFAATPQDANNPTESELSSGSTAANTTAAPRPPGQTQRPPGGPPLTTPAATSAAAAAATTAGTTTPKKKQVAVTSTKRLVAVKRRPLMTRRQSSQSSTGSDPAAGSGGSGGARYSAAADKDSSRASPKPSESSADTLLEEDEEDQDDEPPKPPVQKAAAGKRPVRSFVQAEKRPTAGPKTKLKELPAPVTSIPTKPMPLPVQTTQPLTASPAEVTPVEPVGPATPAEPVTPVELVAPASSAPAATTPVPPSPKEGAEADRTPQPPRRAETTPKKSPSPTATPQSAARVPGTRASIIGGIPLGVRSHSHQGTTGREYRPMMQLGRFVSGPTIAAVTNVAARGVLVDPEGETIGARRQQDAGTLAALEGHGPHLLSQSPPSALISAFVPTPPTRAPAVPMARTMSQLQMVLGMDGGASKRSSAGERPSKRNSRG